MSVKRGKLNLSTHLIRLMGMAAKFAMKEGHASFGGDHLLYCLVESDEMVRQVMEDLSPSSSESYLDEVMDGLFEDGYPKGHITDPNDMLPDHMLEEAMGIAGGKTVMAHGDELDTAMVFHELFMKEEFASGYFLSVVGIDPMELLRLLQSVLPGFGKVIDSPMEEDASPDGWKKYCENLSEEVAEHPIPFVGREDVLEETMQVLSRKTKNNPVHIGAPGVGKTAIAKELAAMINAGDVPEDLKGSTVWSLEMGRVVAGTQFRGQFEQRMTNILDGLSQEEKPILYIDEIHMIVGAGASNESAMDASNILKPYLTKGHIKFIGATTDEEYKKYFEKDKALMRRFKSISVKEPSIADSIQILEGIKGFYEEFHEVCYTTKACESAVELSSKYIQERYLPDKAIDLLDEAGAYATMQGFKTGTKPTVIDEEIIETVISRMTGIPLESLSTTEVDKLMELDTELKKVVFGQDSAIDALVDSIKLSKAGLLEDNKPIGSFLFVGPTGVGKTEIAKQLARIMSVPFIRFDMSEYSEKHSVSKLIGSPAGYVGYDDGGLLVEQIRKNPYAVLLLDEIEKAHPVIFDSLLQVMDNATLTDNKGRKADFRNVILIMTSNAGAREVGRAKLGFGGGTVTDTAITEAVNRTFSPEFRNRLSKTIVFNDITEEIGKLIAEKAMKALYEKLDSKNWELSWDDDTIKYIVDHGLGREYGAREIARIVDQEIKPLFVERLLKEHPKVKTKVDVIRKDEKFEIV